MTSFLVLEGDFTHFVLAGEEFQSSVSGTTLSEAVRVGEGTTHWLHTPAQGGQSSPPPSGEAKPQKKPTVSYREAARALRFSVYRIPLSRFTPEEQQYYTQRREAERFKETAACHVEPNRTPRKEQSTARRLLNALWGWREDPTGGDPGIDDVGGLYRALMQSELPQRYRQVDDAASITFYRKCHQILSNYVVAEGARLPDLPQEKFTVSAPAHKSPPSVDPVGNSAPAAVPTKANEIPPREVGAMPPKPRPKCTGPSPALLRRLQQKTATPTAQAAPKSKEAINAPQVAGSRTGTVETQNEAGVTQKVESVVRKAEEQDTKDAPRCRTRHYPLVSHAGVTRLVYSLVPCDCYHLVTHDNNPLYYAKSSRASYEAHTVHVSLISDLSIRPTYSFPCSTANVVTPAASRPLSTRATQLNQGSNGSVRSSPDPDNTNTVLHFRSRDIMPQPMTEEGLVASAFPSQQPSPWGATVGPRGDSHRSSSPLRDLKRATKDAPLQVERKPQPTIGSAAFFGQISSTTDGFLLITTSLCCNNISGNLKHQKAALLEKGLRLPDSMTGGDSGASPPLSEVGRDPSKAVVNLFQRLSQSSLAQHKLRSGAIRPVVSVAVLDGSRLDAPSLAGRSTSATGVYGEGTLASQQNHDYCCRGLLDHVWFSLPVQHVPPEQDAIQWMPVILGSTDCVSDIGDRSTVHLGIFPSEKAIGAAKDQTSLRPNAERSQRDGGSSGVLPNREDLLNTLAASTPAHPTPPHVSPTPAAPPQRPPAPPGSKRPTDVPVSIAVPPRHGGGETAAGGLMEERHSSSGMAMIFSPDPPKVRPRWTRGVAMTFANDVSAPPRIITASSNKPISRDAGRPNAKPTAWDDTPVRGFGIPPVNSRWDETPKPRPTTQTTANINWEDPLGRPSVPQASGWDKPPVGGTKSGPTPRRTWDEASVVGVRPPATNPWKPKPTGKVPTAWDDTPVRGFGIPPANSRWDDTPKPRPTTQSAVNINWEDPLGRRSVPTEPRIFASSHLVPASTRKVVNWNDQPLPPPQAVEAIDREPDFVRRPSVSVRSPFRFRPTTFGANTVEGNTPEPSRPWGTTSPSTTIVQNSWLNTRTSGFQNPFSVSRHSSRRPSPLVGRPATGRFNSPVPRPGPGVQGGGFGEGPVNESLSAVSAMSVHGDTDAPAARGNANFSHLSNSFAPPPAHCGGLPQPSTHSILASTTAPAQFCINEYTDVSTSAGCRVRQRGVTAMDNVWSRPVPYYSTARNLRLPRSSADMSSSASFRRQAAAAGDMKAPCAAAVPSSSATVYAPTDPLMRRPPLAPSARGAPTVRRRAVAAHPSFCGHKRAERQRVERLHAYEEKLRSSYMAGGERKRARFEMPPTTPSATSRQGAWKGLDTEKAVTTAQQALDDEAQSRSVGLVAPMAAGNADLTSNSERRRREEATQQHSIAEGRRLAVMADDTYLTADGVNVSFTVRDVSNAFLLMSSGRMVVRNICTGAFLPEGVSYFISAKPRKLRGGWESYLERLNLYQEPFYLREQVFVMVLRVPHHPHLRVCVALHNINDFISLLHESPLAKLLPANEEAWMRDQFVEEDTDDDGTLSPCSRSGSPDTEEVTEEVRFFFGLWSTTRRLQRPQPRRSSHHECLADKQRKERCRMIRRQFHAKGLTVTWRHRWDIILHHTRASLQSPFLNACTSPLLTDPSAFQARTSFLSDRIAAYAVVHHRLNTLQALRSAYIAQRAEQIARSRTQRIGDSAHSTSAMLMSGGDTAGVTTSSNYASHSFALPPTVAENSTQRAPSLTASIAVTRTARGGVAMTFDAPEKPTASRSRPPVLFRGPQPHHTVVNTANNSTTTAVTVSPSRGLFHVDRVGKGQCSAITPLQRRRAIMAAARARIHDCGASQGSGTSTTISPYAAPNSLAPTQSAQQADHQTKEQQPSELAKLDLILQVSQDDSLALALSRIEETRRQAVVPPLQVALRLVPFAAQTTRGVGGGVVAQADAALFAGFVPTPLEIQRVHSSFDISISQLQQLLQWQWEHYQHSYTLLPLPVFRGPRGPSLQDYFVGVGRGTAPAGTSLPVKPWQGDGILGTSPLTRVLLLSLCKWAWRVPMGCGPCRRHERFFTAAADVWAYPKAWGHRGTVLRVLVMLTLLSQYPTYFAYGAIIAVLGFCLWSCLRQFVGLHRPLFLDRSGGMLDMEEEGRLPLLHERTSILYRQSEGATEALLGEQYEFSMQATVTRILQLQGIVCAVLSRGQLFLRGYSPLLSLLTAVIALSYLLLFVGYTWIVDAWMAAAWHTLRTVLQHVLPSRNEVLDTVERLRQTLLLHQQLYHGTRDDGSPVSWATGFFQVKGRSSGALYHTTHPAAAADPFAPLQYYQNGKYYTYVPEGAEALMQPVETSATSMKEREDRQAFTVAPGSASIDADTTARTASTSLLESFLSNNRAEQTQPPAGDAVRTITLPSGGHHGNYDVMPFLVFAFVATYYLPYSPLRWLWRWAGKLFIHDDALVRRPLLCF